MGTTFHKKACGCGPQLATFLLSMTGIKVSQITLIIKTTFTLNGLTEFGDGVMDIQQSFLLYVKELMFCRIFFFFFFLFNEDWIDLRVWKTTAKFIHISFIYQGFCNCRVNDILVLSEPVEVCGTTFGQVIKSPKQGLDYVDEL